MSLVVYVGTSISIDLYSHLVCALYAFESPAIGVPYIIQYINNNHSNNDCKKPYSCTHIRAQFYTYRTETRLNDKPFISLCYLRGFQNVFIFYNVPIYSDDFFFF